MNRKTFGYTLLFLFRLLDIPGRVFIKDNSKEIVLLRELANITFNPVILTAICTFCDLLFSLSIHSLDYFILTSMFPNDISSIENSVIHFKLTEFYPLLCLYDPLYLFYLPDILKNLGSVSAVLAFGGKNELGALQAIFYNGFRYNHLPGLNAFWYLFTCAVEQYSKLTYTLNLVYANFLIGNEPRLFPLYRTGASIGSYLPYIHRSKHISLYFTIGFVFEYLYMNFKKNETVNTNFLYWATLIFIGGYMYDLKWGSLCKFKPNK